MESKSVFSLVPVLSFSVPSFVRLVCGKCVGARCSFSLLFGIPWWRHREVFISSVDGNVGRFQFQALVWRCHCQHSRTCHLVSVGTYFHWGYSLECDCWLIRSARMSRSCQTALRSGRTHPHSQRVLCSRLSLRLVTLNLFRFRFSGWVDRSNTF